MQGGEGDCFYVVGSGEFEVFAIQVLIMLSTDFDRLGNFFQYGENPFCFSWEG